jgi:hypothetical protein
MPAETALPALIAEQLAAFERLQPEFAASFHYVQEVQGQRRFPTFPIEASVRYLHALWVCDCKDRLLSVPKTQERYEGQRCLELLERWQTGESAGVVAFLQRKLETLPFADITRQIEAQSREDGARALVERLEHGRLVLLNRGMNLLQALEPLCTFPEQRLLDEVRAACAHYGHQPDQIRHQLVEREAVRSAFVLHPALAQRNMRVMDQLGVQITTDAPDQPGQRTWRVAKRTMPEGPYAEQVIRGYVALTSPWQNNPIGRRLLDVPLPISARASTASA